MELLIFIIILFILFFLLEKIVNKLLGVKKQKISETPGKKIDRWGRGIIAVVHICIAIPYFVINNNISLKWYFIILLIFTIGFQAILEWKYIKNSRQYASTLIILIVGLIFMFNIEFFIRVFSL
ncbi:DUF4181 domain-containing protein [Niallia sp. XMNu-256]|uniref:DUF4181 domain-containing protein n=1 Tax=Niallia sp. XMNu-256 TaxID=3082444 RepID=UPI0030CEEE9C